MDANSKVIISVEFVPSQIQELEKEIIFGILKFSNCLCKIQVKANVIAPNIIVENPVIDLETIFIGSNIEFNIFLKNLSEY